MATYAKSGTGTMGIFHVPVTYVKSGTGALGALTNVKTKTGHGISVFVGSGSKVKTSSSTYVKSGRGITAFTGYAPRYVERPNGPWIGPPMPGPATVKPAIAFPAISGFTFPAVPAPDTGDSAAVFQMIVTEYVPPSTKLAANLITTLPIVNGTTPYGGISIADATSTLRKISVSGFFDTPTVQSGAWRVPNVIDTTSGNRYTYADYIVLCNEGRATKPWARINPLWFRDPLGRVYTNPKVLDFSGTYTEGVPGRVTFQMTLVVVL